MLKDSQIAKLVGITKNSVTSIRNKSYWNYNNLNPKDPVALNLFSQKELIELENQLNNSKNLPSLLADELKIRNTADQCRNELADAMASEQQIRTHESFQARNLLQKSLVIIFAVS